MEKAVLAAIRRFSLLQAGNEVTVALSGGADSMALLHLLVSLKDQLGISLSAAHFNHGIRGNEADRDERFVRTECERLGIPLFCEKGDVPTLAKEKKMGIELAAREARYDFLYRAAPDLIATAHTASDHLETVLMNWIRGSGAKGLSGIPVKNGRVIRPLITSTREEVEAYCQKHGISFVTDSTNLCDDYTRNKLRHRVIPVLKELNPSLEQAAFRASASLAEDEETLSLLADRYLSSHARDGELDLCDFPMLSAAVKKRIVKHFAQQAIPGLRLDSKHTEEMAEICMRGGRMSLPMDYYAVSGAEILSLQPAKASVRYRVETRAADFENSPKVHNLFLKNTVDCDKIVGKTVIRTREPGDRICLAGSRCTKTLKKLYLEKRIPLALRQVLPVMADEQGIIWIYGIGVANRCAISKKTKRVVIIETREEKI